MKKEPLPKIPKILKDELIEAIDQAINDFGLETLDEYLQRRAKLSPLQRYICEHGISGKVSIDSIGLLERALEKFRKYENNGADDYISSAVESRLAKRRSSQRIRRRNDFGAGYIDIAERNKTIIEIATRANYENSNDKGSIVNLITDQLTANGQSLSAPQIRRILSDAGLTRKKKRRT